jgi:acetyl esterase
MDYVLDPELAAVAPMIPALDLSDVPGMRALARQFLGSAPQYESEGTLSVEEITILGYQGAPDVGVRVHAPSKRTGPIPGLL